MNVVKRGFTEHDLIEFGSRWEERMNAAAVDLLYLRNHGYKGKSASVFVGNHYCLSERQRLALMRSISTDCDQNMRLNKQISSESMIDTVSIDGFNTVITLETALSGSLLLEGRDGCIRDLAGLRGTYRIIDKTVTALQLIFGELEFRQIPAAVFYLDQPVSNSGRLKHLILETAVQYPISVQAETICNVDQVLSAKKNVITSDGIILNHCISWYNLNRTIIQNHVPNAWIYRFHL